jgi:hypothetical protein
MDFNTQGRWEWTGLTKFQAYVRVTQFIRHHLHRLALRKCRQDFFEQFPYNRASTRVAIDDKLEPLVHSGGSFRGVTMSPDQKESILKSLSLNIMSSKFLYRYLDITTQRLYKMRMHKESGRIFHNESHCPVSVDEEGYAQLIENIKNHKGTGGNPMTYVELTALVNAVAYETAKRRGLNGLKRVANGLDTRTVDRILDEIPQFSVRMKTEQNMAKQCDKDLEKEVGMEAKAMKRQAREDKKRADEVLAEAKIESNKRAVEAKEAKMRLKVARGVAASHANK